MKPKKILIALASLAVAGIVIRLIYFWPPVTYLRGKLFSQFFRRSPGTLGLTILKLPVVFHRQEHALSCEVAALKMALAAQGIDVAEDRLLEKLMFDTTPKTGRVWGDPYAGFVGDIDGKMGVSGYGVYWDPIRDLANKYTYSEVIANATPQDLALHLSQGRPIVWWGYYGRGKEINWQTPAGKQISGVSGEHARVITGFVGSLEEPFGFYLLDPIYGELFWETSELMQNSAPFLNSGVVVHSLEQVFSQK